MIAVADPKKGEFPVAIWDDDGNTKIVSSTEWRKSQTRWEYQGDRDGWRIAKATKGGKVKIRAASILQAMWFPLTVMNS